MIYLLIAGALSFVIVVSHETVARNILLNPLLAVVEDPLLVSALHLFWETATVVFLVSGGAYIAAGLGLAPAQIAFVPAAIYFGLAIMIFYLAVTSKAEGAMLKLSQWVILALIAALGTVGALQML